MAVDPSLLESKLRPPKMRTDLVARPALEEILGHAVERSLTVVSAPTGYGKTTLINAWARRSGLAIAWLTLEASENDPARLLQHIAGAIERAGGPNPVPTNRWASIPGADLAGTVVPMMLNELAGRSQPIVLILDDCHVLTDPRCHDVLSALVRWTPETLRIVIASRADPPLPLGRWRASGQLSELRVADLRFGGDEADQFLNDVLGLGLDGSSVEVLQERTEGWPAGLYLAALSLMSRADRAGFIREFAGSSRHVVDYLAPEVLDPLDPDDRRFLLETSILERLSGSLCDLVTGRSDSAARLSELYRSNLFLTALDDDGTWFRHHRLFGQLLNALLANESPDLVPELHGRAADWHAEHGPLELLVRHALLAGRRDQASLAVARDWRTLTSAGHYDTLQALLDALGPDRGTLTAPLASIEAINAGLRGSAHELIERWLAVAEHAPWDGPTPDGLEDISISIAVARASVIGKDLSTSIESSRRLIGRQPGAPYVDGMGRASLGMGLVLMGDPAGALTALEGFGDYPEAPLVDLYGLAARALALTMSGDASGGETVAALAHLRAHAAGLIRSLVGGVVALASGVAMAHQGRVQEAQPFLEEALRYWGIPVDSIPRAYVLLSMAPVVADNGDLERARQLAREARVILSGCPDGGALPTLLDRVERGLNVRMKGNLRDGDMPTEAEVRVLRLLAGPLPQSGIAAALFLSTNTVKTHVKAINRRLGTTSRPEAVERARELGLI